nr:MAG TPA: hypothetical protein [Bacteriophage sp.]
MTHKSLIILNEYSCPWEMSQRHQMLYAQTFVSSV